MSHPGEPMAGSLTMTLETRPNGTSISFRALLGIFIFHTVFFTVFFSPVWLQGNRLIVGDALKYHYPAYHGGHNLWEPALLGGFPKFADPQFQLWYPPALLLSLLHVPFDVFVLLSYILAGTFAHAFLMRVTGSWLAGCVAGLVFGTCGFMTCHQGHTAVTHVAAWLPLILWALEELYQQVRRKWFAILVGAVACCMLAGHTQIAVLCFILSGLYFLHLLPVAPNRRIFFWTVMKAYVLGLALCTVQILPTAELTFYSVLQSPNYDHFCAYHFPSELLPSLIFPYAYGYFWLPGERRHWALTQYELLPEYLATSTMFALIAIFVVLLCGRRQRRSWFWLAVMIVSILAALGSDGPLAPLLFRLPVMNRFRCPGRFVLWYGLASACLAGYAVSLLMQLPPRKSWKFSLTALGLALVLMSGVLMYYRHQLASPLFQSAQMAVFPPDSPFKSALPWVNPMLGIPLGCLLLSGAALTAFVAFRGRLSQVILLACVIVDGGSFAWLWHWQDRSTPVAELKVPDALAEVGATMRQHHTRLDSLTPALAISWPSPNLNLLLGIENTRGYTPLLPRRLALTHGSPSVLAKLLAVEYYEGLVENTYFGPYPPFWFVDGTIGGSQRAGKSTLRFHVPNIPIVSFTVVSSLLDSSAITQGTGVIEVLVRGEHEEVLRVELQAGRDTADAEMELLTTAGTAGHKPVTLYSSVPKKDSQGNLLRHQYIREVWLPHEITAQQIEFNWIGPAHAACTVACLYLTDSNKERHPYLDTAAVVPQEPAKRLPDTNIWFARTAAASPRAWLVPEAVPLGWEPAFHALRSAQLPDGRSLDVRQQVLVENLAAGICHPTDPRATAEILSLQSDRVQVRTQCEYGSFLVLADSWYPGWQVSIDGQAAPLLRANYVVRGVQLPPGEHEVTFVFRPLSFYLGLTTSLLALLALGYLMRP